MGMLLNLSNVEIFDCIKYSAAGQEILLMSFSDLMCILLI